MTRALKKTKECFAQLLAGLSKLELVWENRVYEPDGTTSVPVAWAGQPVLLVMPGAIISEAPTVDKHAQFKAAVSLEGLADDSDIIRCQNGIDNALRRLVDDVPELAARAARPEGERNPPFEGLLRSRRVKPHITVRWIRGGATITDKRGELLEPAELIEDGAGGCKADCRLLAAQLTVNRDGAARVHCLATEIKRTAY